jgi:hypothetical protein
MELHPSIAITSGTFKNSVLIKISDKVTRPPRFLNKNRAPLMTVGILGMVEQKGVLPRPNTTKT